MGALLACVPWLGIDRKTRWYVWWAFDRDRVRNWIALNGLRGVCAFEYRRPDHATRGAEIIHECNALQSRGVFVSNSAVRGVFRSRTAVSPKPRPFFTRRRRTASAPCERVLLEEDSRASAQSSLNRGLSRDAGLLACRSLRPLGSAAGASPGRTAATGRAATAGRTTTPRRPWWARRVSAAQRAGFEGCSPGSVAAGDAVHRGVARRAVQLLPRDGR